MGMPFLMNLNRNEESFDQSKLCFNPKVPLRVRVIVCERGDEGVSVNEIMPQRDALL